MALFWPGAKQKDRRAMRNLIGGLFATALIAAAMLTARRAGTAPKSNIRGARNTRKGGTALAAPIAASSPGRNAWRRSAGIGGICYENPRYPAAATNSTAKRRNQTKRREQH